MYRLLRRLPSFLLAPALAAAAQPMGLIDPTRPPGAQPVQAAASTRTAAAVPAGVPLQPPLVQSVQLGRGGAATALVDGRLLRVGDRLGDAQVVAIDMKGLQVRGPRGLERLWLLAALNDPPPPPPRPAPPTVAVAGDK